MTTFITLLCVAGAIALLSIASTGPGFSNTQKVHQFAIRRPWLRSLFVENWPNRVTEGGEFESSLFQEASWETSTPNYSGNCGTEFDYEEELWFFAYGHRQGSPAQTLIVPVPQGVKLLDFWQERHANSCCVERPFAVVKIHSTKPAFSANWVDVTIYQVPLYLEVPAIA